MRNDREGPRPVPATTRRPVRVLWLAAAFLGGWFLGQAHFPVPAMCVQHSPAAPVAAHQAAPRWLRALRARSERTR